MINVVGNGSDTLSLFAADPRLPRLVEYKRLMTKLIDLTWKTYQRLKSRHDALVEVSSYDIGRKLGFLHKLQGR